VIRAALAFALCIGFAVAQSTTAPKEETKKSATVEGRTLGVDGSPLRKSTVILRQAYNPNRRAERAQTYATTSDAEGKFIFEDVEPDSYMLVGQHPGYIESHYGTKKAGDAPATLSLTPSLHVREIEFALTPRTIISGRVLDDEGDPVPNGIVQLLRNSYPNGRRQLLPFSQTQADVDGEYKISNLLPGRYLLAAVPPRISYFEPVHKNGPRGDPAKPEEELVTTYFPSALDAASATTIEVVAGRDIRGTDLQLRKSQVFRIRGKLSGSINPELGTALRISITRRDSFIMDFFGSTSANVEKDGSFDLRGVPAGPYRLMVTTGNGMIRTLARQNIDVGSHDIEGVSVVLQPSGSIRGAIQVARTTSPDAEKPTPVLSNMMIRLEPAAGMTNGTPFGTLKPDGSFVFDDVAADQYRLRINYLPDGTYVKSARLGDQDVLVHDLDLAGGVGAAAMEIVLSATAGQIDGTVQTDQQKTATGVQVTLIPDPADPARTDLFTNAVTDQNGQFSLKNLTPGKYRIYAWEEIENGIQHDPEFMKPLVELGTKITVEENGRHAQALTWISVAQMEQARAK
jgi:hypothetical protein